MLVAVLFALLSALFYALASVLQQRAAAVMPARQSLRLGLLARLARNPLWLLGTGADIAGYVFQFIALDHGSLVAVQPLLVCGLLFALPLGAWWERTRMTALDWSAAAAVCIGLSVFLAVAGSARGHRHPSNGAWLALLVSAGGAAAVLLLGARGQSPRRRAALYSGAAGLIYGVAAGFTKAAGLLLHHGVIHLLTSWQVWGLVLTGVVGMVVAQSAFQAGALDSSLPTMTVVDPVVSILIGWAAFGERLPSSGWATTTEILSLVVMAVGVFGLARAKAVTAIQPA